MYTVIYDPILRGNINVVEDSLVAGFDATGLTTATKKIDPTTYGQSGTPYSRVLYGAVEDVMYHEGITDMEGRAITLMDVIAARWFEYTGDKDVQVAVAATATSTLTIKPDTSTSSFSDVSDLTVVSTDEAVATAQITAVNGKDATLEITGVAAGQAQVTVTFEDASLTFDVTVA